MRIWAQKPLNGFTESEAPIMSDEMAKVSVTHIPLKIRTTQPILPTYRIMIIDILASAFHDIDVNGIWSQQNGPTCHTSHAAVDLSNFV